MTARSGHVGVLAGCFAAVTFAATLRHLLRTLVLPVSRNDSARPLRGGDAQECGCAARDSNPEPAD